MAKHSKFSASGAHRWFECPGSIKLCEGIPSTTSPYAEEGTAAHELCEKVVNESPNANFYLGKKFNGFEVTQEMADAADMYADEVLSDANFNKGKIKTEVKVSLKHIEKTMFGTCDALVYSDSTLVVLDFKYGAGIPVDVDDNPQLLYYALGATKTLKIKPKQIIIKIVQPRAQHEDGPIRSVKISYDDLMSFEALLKEKVKAVRAPDAPLKDGEHCRFCPAKATCPQLQASSMEITQMNLSQAEPSFPPVETLTDAQLVKIITHESVIKSFFSAVKEQAQIRIENGEDIEGLKLVNTRSSRVWTESDEKLEELLGSEVYEKKLRTVAQAEKIFGKKKIQEFYEVQTGRTTVTHEKDRRRAVAKPAIESFNPVFTTDDF